MEGAGAGGDRGQWMPRVTRPGTVGAGADCASRLFVAGSGDGWVSGGLRLWCIGLRGPGAEAIRGTRKLLDRLWLLPWVSTAKIKMLFQRYLVPMVTNEEIHLDYANI